MVKNLEHWRDKAVFKDEAGACRGNLTVSMAAGEEGEGDPVISEEGRAFLLQQLRRLTPEHLRAIFTAARAEMLDESRRDQDETTAGSIAGVDAWVAAFETKIGEIERRRCPHAR